MRWTGIAGVQHFIDVSNARAVLARLRFLLPEVLAGQCKPQRERRGFAGKAAKMQDCCAGRPDIVLRHGAVAISAI